MGFSQGQNNATISIGLEINATPATQYTLQDVHNKIGEIRKDADLSIAGASEYFDAAEDQAKVGYERIGEIDRILGDSTVPDFTKVNLSKEKKMIISSLETMFADLYDIKDTTVRLAKNLTGKNGNIDAAGLEKLAPMLRADVNRHAKIGYEEGVPYLDNQIVNMLKKDKIVRGYLDSRNIQQDSDYEKDLLRYFTITSLSPLQRASYMERMTKDGEIRDHLFDSFSDMLTEPFREYHNSGKKITNFRKTPTDLTEAERKSFVDLIKKNPFLSQITDNLGISRRENGYIEFLKNITRENVNETAAHIYDLMIESALGMPKYGITDVDNPEKWENIARKENKPYFATLNGSRVLSDLFQSSTWFKPQKYGSSNVNSITSADFKREGKIDFAPVIKRYEVASYTLDDLITGRNLNDVNRDYKAEDANDRYFAVDDSIFMRNVFSHRNYQKLKNPNLSPKEKRKLAAERIVKNNEPIDDLFYVALDPRFADPTLSMEDREGIIENYTNWMVDENGELVVHNRKHGKENYEYVWSGIVHPHLGIQFMRKDILDAMNEDDPSFLTAGLKGKNPKDPLNIEFDNYADYAPVREYMTKTMTTGQDAGEMFGLSFPKNLKVKVINLKEAAKGANGSGAGLDGTSWISTRLLQKGFQGRMQGLKGVLTPMDFKNLVEKYGGEGFYAQGVQDGELVKIEGDEDLIINLSDLKNYKEAYIKTGMNSEQVAQDVVQNLLPNYGMSVSRTANQAVKSKRWISGQMAQFMRYNDEVVRMSTDAFLKMYQELGTPEGAMKYIFPGQSEMANIIRDSQGAGFKSRLVQKRIQEARDEMFKRLGKGDLLLPEDVMYETAMGSPWVINAINNSLDKIKGSDYGLRYYQDRYNAARSASDATLMKSIETDAAKFNIELNNTSGLFEFKRKKKASSLKQRYKKAKTEATKNEILDEAKQNYLKRNSEGNFVEMTGLDVLFDKMADEQVAFIKAVTLDENDVVYDTMLKTLGLSRLPATNTSLQSVTNALADQRPDKVIEEEKKKLQNYNDEYQNALKIKDATQRADTMNDIIKRATGEGFVQQGSKFDTKRNLKSDLIRSLMNDLGLDMSHVYFSTGSPLAEFLQGADFDGDVFELFDLITKNLDPNDKSARAVYGRAFVFARDEMNKLYKKYNYTDERIKEMQEKMIQPLFDSKGRKFNIKSAKDAVLFGSLYQLNNSSMGGPHSLMRAAAQMEMGQEVIDAFVRGNMMYNVNSTQGKKAQHIEVSPEDKRIMGENRPFTEWFNLVDSTRDDNGNFDARQLRQKVNSPISGEPEKFWKIQIPYNTMSASVRAMLTSRYFANKKGWDINSNYDWNTIFNTIFGDQEEDTTTAIKRMQNAYRKIHKGFLNSDFLVLADETAWQAQALRKKAIEEEMGIAAKLAKDNPDEYKKRYGEGQNMKHAVTRYVDNRGGLAISKLLEQGATETRMYEAGTDSALWLESLKNLGYNNVVGRIDLFNGASDIEELNNYYKSVKEKQRSYNKRKYDNQQALAYWNNLTEQQKKQTIDQLGGKKRNLSYSTLSSAAFDAFDFLDNYLLSDNKQSATLAETEIGQSLHSGLRYFFNKRQEYQKNNPKNYHIDEKLLQQWAREASVIYDAELGLTLNEEQEKIRQSIKNFESYTSSGRQLTPTEKAKVLDPMQKIHETYSKTKSWILSDLISLFPSDEYEIVGVEGNDENITDKIGSRIKMGGMGERLTEPDKDVGMTGSYDLLVKNRKTGQIEIADYKVYKDPTERDRKKWRTQQLTYAEAIRSGPAHLAAARYNMILPLRNQIESVDITEGEISANTDNLKRAIKLIQTTFTKDNLTPNDMMDFEQAMNQILYGIDSEHSMYGESKTGASAGVTGQTISGALLLHDDYEKTIQELDSVRQFARKNKKKNYGQDSSYNPWNAQETALSRATQAATTAALNGNEAESRRINEQVNIARAELFDALVGPNQLNHGTDNAVSAQYQDLSLLMTSAMSSGRYNTKSQNQLFENMKAIRGKKNSINNTYKTLVDKIDTTQKEIDGYDEQIKEINNLISTDPANQGTITKAYNVFKKLRGAFSGFAAGTLTDAEKQTQLDAANDLLSDPDSYDIIKQYKSIADLISPVTGRFSEVDAAKLEGIIETQYVSLDKAYTERSAENMRITDKREQAKVDFDRLVEARAEADKSAKDSEAMENRVDGIIRNAGKLDLLRIVGNMNNKPFASKGSINEDIFAHIKDVLSAKDVLEQYKNAGLFNAFGLGDNFYNQINDELNKALSRESIIKFRDEAIEKRIEKYKADKVTWAKTPTSQEAMRNAILEAQEKKTNDVKGTLSSIEEDLKLSSLTPEQRKDLEDLQKYYQSYRESDYYNELIADKEKQLGLKKEDRHKSIKEWASDSRTLVGLMNTTDEEKNKRLKNIDNYESQRIHESDELDRYQKEMFKSMYTGTTVDRNMLIDQKFYEARDKIRKTMTPDEWAEWQNAHPDDKLRERIKKEMTREFDRQDKMDILSSMKSTMDLRELATGQKASNDEMIAYRVKQAQSMIDLRKSELDEKISTETDKDKKAQYQKEKDELDKLTENMIKDRQAGAVEAMGRTRDRKLKSIDKNIQRMKDGLYDGLDAMIQRALDSAEQQIDDAITEKNLGKKEADKLKNETLTDAVKNRIIEDTTREYEIQRKREEAGIGSAYMSLRGRLENTFGTLTYKPSEEERKKLIGADITYKALDVRERALIESRRKGISPEAKKYYESIAKMFDPDKEWMKKHLPGFIDSESDKQDLEASITRMRDKRNTLALQELGSSERLDINQRVQRRMDDYERSIDEQRLALERSKENGAYVNDKTGSYKRQSDALDAMKRQDALNAVREKFNAIETYNENAFQAKVEARNIGIEAELSSGFMSKNDRIKLRAAEIKAKAEEHKRFMLESGMWKSGSKALKDFEGEYTDSIIRRQARKQVEDQDALADMRRKNELNAIDRRMALESERYPRMYEDYFRSNRRYYATTRIGRAIMGIQDQAFNLQRQIGKNGELTIRKQNAKEDLAYNQDALERYISRTGKKESELQDDQKYKELKFNRDRSQRQLDSATNAYNDAEQAAKRFNGAAGTTRLLFEQLSASATAFAVRFGRQLFNKAIQETKKFTLEFNKAMTEIQAITLKTNTQMQSVRENTINKAIDLHTSVANVASTEAALYRQGLSDAEVDTRTEDVIKFATVAGVKTEAATKILTTALQNNLVGSAEEAMDALVALGDNAATTAEDIGKAMQKCASAAKVAGVSYEELTAMLATMTSMTQLGGTQIGTAMNTILTRMRKVTLSKYVRDQNGETTTLSDVEDALTMAGIDLRDPSDKNKFRSTTDVLLDISKKWQGMSDISKASITSAVAGTRMGNIFQTLMEGMSEDDGETFEKYLGLAGGSEGVTDKKYEVHIQSITAAIETLKSTFDSLISGIESSGLIQGAIGFITSIVDGLRKLPPAIGTIGTAITALIPIVSTLIGLVIGKGNPIFALIGMIAGVIGGIGFGGILSGIGNITNNNAEQNKKYKEDYNNYINGAKKNYNERESLIEETEKLIEKRKELGDSFNKTSDASALEDNIKTLVQIFPELSKVIDENVSQLENWSNVVSAAKKSLSEYKNMTVEQAEILARVNAKRFFDKEKQEGIDAIYESAFGAKNIDVRDIMGLSDASITFNMHDMDFLIKRGMPERVAFLERANKVFSSARDDIKQSINETEENKKSINEAYKNSQNKAADALIENVNKANQDVLEKQRVFDEAYAAETEAKAEYEKVLAEIGKSDAYVAFKRVQYDRAHKAVEDYNLDPEIYDKKENLNNERLLMLSAYKAQLKEMKWEPGVEDLYNRYLSLSDSSNRAKLGTSDLFDIETLGQTEFIKKFLINYSLDSSYVPKEFLDAFLTSYGTGVTIDLQKMFNVKGIGDTDERFSSYDAAELVDRMLRGEDHKMLVKTKEKILSQIAESFAFKYTGNEEDFVPSFIKSLYSNRNIDSSLSFIKYNGQSNKFMEDFVSESAGSDDTLTQLMLFVYQMETTDSKEFSDLTSEIAEILGVSFEDVSPELVEKAMAELEKAKPEIEKINAQIEALRGGDLSSPLLDDAVIGLMGDIGAIEEIIAKFRSLRDDEEKALAELNDAAGQQAANNDQSQRLASAESELTEASKRSSQALKELETSKLNQEKIRTQYADFIESGSYEGLPQDEEALNELFRAQGTLIRSQFKLVAKTAKKNVLIKRLRSMGYSDDQIKLISSPIPLLGSSYTKDKTPMTLNLSNSKEAISAVLANKKSDAEILGMTSDQSKSMSSLLKQLYDLNLFDNSGIYTYVSSGEELAKRWESQGLHGFRDENQEAFEDIVSKVFSAVSTGGEGQIGPYLGLVNKQVSDYARAEVEKYRDYYVPYYGMTEDKTGLLGEAMLNNVADLVENDEEFKDFRDEEGKVDWNKLDEAALDRLFYSSENSVRKQMANIGANDIADYVRWYMDGSRFAFQYRRPMKDADGNYVYEGDTLKYEDVGYESLEKAKEAADEEIARLISNGGYETEEEKETLRKEVYGNIIANGRAVYGPDGMLDPKVLLGTAMSTISPKNRGFDIEYQSLLRDVNKPGGIKNIKGENLEPYQELIASLGDYELLKMWNDLVNENGNYTEEQFNSYLQQKVFGATKASKTSDAISNAYSLRATKKNLDLMEKGEGNEYLYRLISSETKKPIQWVRDNYQDAVNLYREIYKQDELNYESGIRADIAAEYEQDLFKPTHDRGYENNRDAISRGLASPEILAEYNKKYKKIDDTLKELNEKYAAAGLHFEYSSDKGLVITNSEGKEISAYSSIVDKTPTLSTAGVAKAASKILEIGDIEKALEGASNDEIDEMLAAVDKYGLSEYINMTDKESEDAQKRLKQIKIKISADESGVQSLEELQKVLSGTADLVSQLQQGGAIEIQAIGKISAESFTRSQNAYDLRNGNWGEQSRAAMSILGIGEDQFFTDRGHYLQLAEKYQQLMDAQLAETFNQYRERATSDETRSLLDDIAKMQGLEITTDEKGNVTYKFNPNKVQKQKMSPLELRSKIRQEAEDLNLTDEYRRYAEGTYTSEDLDKLIKNDETFKNIYSSSAVGRRQNLINYSQRMSLGQQGTLLQNNESLFNEMFGFGWQTKMLNEDYYTNEDNIKAFQTALQGADRETLINLLGQIEGGDVIRKVLSGETKTGDEIKQAVEAISNLTTSESFRELKDAAERTQEVTTIRTGTETERQQVFGQYVSTASNFYAAQKGMSKIDLEEGQAAVAQALGLDQDYVKTLSKSDAGKNVLESMMKEQSKKAAERMAAVLAESMPELENFKVENVTSFDSLIEELRSASEGLDGSAREKLESIIEGLKSASDALSPGTAFQNALDSFKGAGNTARSAEWLRDNLWYIEENAGNEFDIMSSSLPTTFDEYVAGTEKQDRRFGLGNIDLSKRPTLYNDDGTISTVKSMSITEDGEVVLIPTIREGEGGRAIEMSEEEAIDYYHETGQFLGKFKSVPDANNYARVLHEDQELTYTQGNERDWYAPLNVEEGKAYNPVYETRTGVKGAIDYMYQTGMVPEGVDLNDFFKEHANLAPLLNEMYSGQSDISQQVFNSMLNQVLSATTTGGQLPFDYYNLSMQSMFGDLFNGGLFDISGFDSLDKVQQIGETIGELFKDDETKGRIEELTSKYSSLNEAFTKLRNGDIEGARESLEEFNAEFTRDRVNDITKHNRALSDLPDIFADISRGGPEAEKAMRKINNRLKDYQDQKTAVQNAKKKKSGAELDDDTLDILAQASGGTETKESIKKMKDQTYEKFLKEIDSSVDTESSEFISKAAEGLLASIPKTVLNLNLGDYIEVKESGEIQLTDLANSLSETERYFVELISSFIEAMQATIGFDLTQEDALITVSAMLEKIASSHKGVTANTKGGYHGGGGGGGGGGESESAKAIKQAKRDLMEIEHIIKMTDIQIKKMDRLNNWDGFLSGISTAIGAQNELARVYQENINNLSAQRANVEAGSDDWWDLTEAIYGYEEALAEVSEKIAEYYHMIFEEAKEQFGYKINEKQHDINMSGIDRTFFQRTNDYESEIKLLDTMQQQNLALADTYREAIGMYKGLADFEYGMNGKSDYWEELQQEIRSTEESLAELKNTMSELDAQKLDVTVEMQETIRKPDDNAYTKMDLYKERFLGREDYKAYETLMARRKTLIGESLTNNSDQIAQLESLLASFEYESDEWIATRDKIWELKIDSATKENELIDIERELADQRLANIQQANDRDNKFENHAINMLDTQGGTYNAISDYASYRGTLVQQADMWSEIHDRTLQARDAALEQMKVLAKNSPEWYNARDAVYEYEEAVAKAYATMKEKQYAVEESLAKELTERYNDTMSIYDHEAKLMKDQATIYDNDNDFNAYRAMLIKQNELLADQTEGRRYYLAELKDRLANTTIGTSAWKDLRKEILSVEQAISSAEVTLANFEDELKKSEIDHMLEKMNRAQANRTHALTMIQYEETKYQNVRELTNYGIMVGKENEVREADIKANERDIELLEEQMEGMDITSDQYRRLVDEIKKKEEAIIADSNAIAKNNELLKENANKIKQVKKAVEDQVDAEIKKRIEEEKRQLAATVTLQNEILNLVRQRYRDEWDLIKKDIQKKQEALAEEKNLINERLNARKAAMDAEDKYEQLRMYENQLALIQSDPTRSREAKELQKKIEDLRKNISWDRATEEAASSSERLQDQIDAMSDYVEVNEENLNAMLENANNMKDEVNAVLYSSYEDIVLWMQENNTEFKNSLDEAQLQMVQGWETTWKTMHGIVDTYWEEIAKTISSKSDFLKYMKDSVEYLTASAAGQSILEYQWGRAYDDMVASTKVDRYAETYVPHTHPDYEKISSGNVNWNYDSSWWNSGRNPDVYYGPINDYNLGLAPEESRYVPTIEEFRDRYEGVGKPRDTVTPSQWAYVEAVPFDLPIAEVKTNQGMGGGGGGSGKGGGGGGGYTKLATGFQTFEIETSALEEYVRKNNIKTKTKDGKLVYDLDMRDVDNLIKQYPDSYKQVDGLSFYEQAKNWMNPDKGTQGVDIFKDASRATDIFIGSPEDKSSSSKQFFSEQKEMLDYESKNPLNSRATTEDKTTTKEEKQQIAESVTGAVSNAVSNAVQSAVNWVSNLFHFKEGGLVNFTGPAWVDGTFSQPESFLDAEDTRNVAMLAASLHRVTTMPSITPSESMFNSNNNTVGDIYVTLNEAKLETNADYEEVARRVGKALNRELSKEGFSLTSYAL